jgi:hypothetical protein
MPNILTFIPQSPDAMTRYFFALLLLLLCLAAQAQDHEVKPTEVLTVSGAVKNELHLTLRDLLTFRQEKLGDVMITNKQGKEKGVAKNMRGVLLKTIIDSAHIVATKHKEYSELCISLIASDGYRNVYSWNELFNTTVGDHVYIITESDGVSLAAMPQRILVMSLADINSGRRHLKGLDRIEIKKVQ